MRFLLCVISLLSVSVSHTRKHGFAILHDLTDGFANMGDQTVTVFSVSLMGKHGFATLHDLTDGLASMGDLTVSVLVFLTWENMGLLHCKT